MTFHIGDRVVCIDGWDGNYNIEEHEGIVRLIQGHFITVEFNEHICDCYNANEVCYNGNGWIVHEGCLEFIYPQTDDGHSHTFAEFIRRVESAKLPG